ncbi:ATP-binding cassette, subfamily B [Quadrisphaera granulorum]|uniref:ATP-binding cassette subfamily B protein n=1 Tax=Quadrisphaera granulorum TaxID=317664 RepID=A0A316AZX7_9ACTN|nr:ABC transporter ATP-binding protein [Quadrisphaera granulorum]PWJ55807.1 ATP-binding cassette subfamily B protein [Quadrisphaera granulorum]SZE95304.1 ATP-binding cassette, subfamily B [Quadrisphaera granulorum]
MRREGLRSLLPHLRDHRRPLAAAAALSLVTAAAGLAQPLLVRRVIDGVQVGASVGTAVAAVVVVLLAGSLIGAVQQYLLQRTAEGVVLATRRRLVGRLLRLPVAELDARRTGDLISRVGSDTTLLRAVVTSGLLEVASSALLAMGAVVAMALVDPLLLGVTLLAVGVGVAAGVGVGRRLRELARTSQERVGAMTAAVERALGAVRTLRASGATDREVDAVGRAAEQAYDAGVRAARVQAVISPLVGVAVQGAFVAVLGVGGYRVASGSISVADLVAFILYLFLLVMPLGQLLGAYSQLQLGLGALSRVEEVLALGEEDPGPRADPPPARSATPGPAALLELDSVSFTHPGSQTRVLDGVSFRVEPGTRTALVGPSGAGKSTLLGLLERFADPTSGSIRLDGVDLRDLPRAALRARLGYVEQEAPVLAGTLRENLLLAAPRATDDEVAGVLAAVGLSALVTRSPLGLDAPVGEGGVLLSGGERQRLAICRSLLANPDLLLLDEPTASLDARNEAALARALDAVQQRSTALIVVAHRLSTVVDADQIVVLDAGRVVGIGRHEELLESTPLYRELAMTQLLVAD